MTCGSCGKALPEATVRRRFCNAICRARYWREEQKREIREALDQAERAIRRARAGLRGLEESG